LYALDRRGRAVDGLRFSGRFGDYVALRDGIAAVESRPRPDGSLPLFLERFDLRGRRVSGESITLFDAPMHEPGATRASRDR
jgi:hypothetical protein